MTLPPSNKTLATQLRQAAGIAAFACVLSAAARANVVSAFDTGTEGWSGVSFTNLSADNYALFSTAAPVFNATGGNPGGFISIVDPDNGDFTFSAPAPFLENHTGATGLSCSLTDSSTVDYQTSDVIITRGGLRLLWRRDPQIVPGPTFQTISVPFTPSAEWTAGTQSGALATEADFQTVLSGVTGLFIRGDYHAGLDETTGLDTVTLTEAAAVPEPGSLAVLGFGLFGAGLSRRARLRPPH